MTDLTEYIRGGLGVGRAVDRGRHALLGGHWGTSRQWVT